MPYHAHVVDARATVQSGLFQRPGGRGGRRSVVLPLFQLKDMLPDEGFPHGEKVRLIDSKDMNGDSPNGCPAGQHCSYPLEVLMPLVRPRMEEPHYFARVGIGSGNVRTLVPVAVKTGKGEILEDRLPAMLARNDVIDMKGQRIDRSREPAILAPVLRALPDLAGNLPVHE